MLQKLKGNIKGLGPRDKKALERLFTRRVPKESIVSLALAQELHELATSLRRRIGLLIGREGDVLEVFLGTKDILYIPELKRYHLAAGRLRRLRLVFSDLSKSENVTIPRDIYTDLEKLRFDMVASVKNIKGSVHVSYAYNLPYQGKGSESVATETIKNFTDDSFHFHEFITDLEGEIALKEKGVKKQQSNSALLVGVYSKQNRAPESSLDELKELADTAGVIVADSLIQIRNPDPKTFVGKGKLEEIVLECLRLGAELLIFDAELKPTQWRNITDATDLKVLDRSMLILDIFSQRASSSDGRLQVELAQLKYNLPRLAEKEAGLSRLVGGIGGRGPGETKLEIGRRRSRDRIAELEKRIDKLGKNRELRRQQRKKAGKELVAIVGYTNAGKSTLFNSLTKSDSFAEDKLFATLDPAQRKLFLPPPEFDPEIEYDPKQFIPREVILSDTVGFIRDLPKELTNAFRATLEELYQADLLLHVLDGSDELVGDKHRSVMLVLEEMGLLETPCITLMNKADLLSQEKRTELANEYQALLVSAKAKEGLSEVLGQIRSVVCSS